MRIANSGNVGIGTTAPNNPLEVNGEIATTSSGKPITARYNASNDNYASSLVWNATAGGVLELGNNGGNEIRAGRTGVGGSMRFMVNNTAADTAASDGTEAMRLTSAGNVGIGLTNPGYPLEVNGIIQGDSDIYWGGGFHKLTTSGGGGNSVIRPWAGIQLDINGSGSGAGIQTAFFAHPGTPTDIYAGTDNTTAEPIRLNTLSANSGGSQQVRMYVAPITGNVGVGTTAPGHALDVQGGDGYINAKTGLCINGTCETSVPSGSAVGGSGTGSYDSIWNGTGSNLTTGLLYESGGNVGIGTTNPVQKLDVAGNINIASGNLLQFAVDGRGISKAPQFYFTRDANAGCPGALAANTAVITQTVTLTRAGFFHSTAQDIASTNGRVDMTMYVDGAAVMTWIQYTPSAQWQSFSLSYTGALAAGAHTIDYRAGAANTIGCGGVYGGISTTVFEN